MPITRQFVVRSTVVLLAIGFSALLFVVLATLQLSQRAQQYLTDVTTARETLVAATLVREGLLTTESSQLGFIVTGNEIYLAPYENAKEVVSAELENLRSMLSARQDREELLVKLSAVVVEKLKDQGASIALRESGRESDAIDSVKSNRGKMLMDEANLYLNAIILENDERLAVGVAEQTSNANWLRWSSLASALVIVFVVGGVMLTISRYTSEVLAARDGVRQANESLEARVIERTEELAQARDRAQLLLEEVNHRVANSLGLVNSLVRLQARSLTEPSAKAALEETTGRIQAIAELHKNLFATVGVGNVDAATYLDAVLSQIEAGMASAGSGSILSRKLSPVTLPTSDAINLAIIVTEWVTNAFKYAYTNGRGEIRVRLAREGDSVVALVEDDGIGRGAASEVKGTGIGTRVVTAIAGSMRAHVQYSNRNPGTQARLSFKLSTAAV